jgi:hypothetical protein
MEAAIRKSVRLGEKLAEDIRTKRVYIKQSRIHEQNGKYFRQLVNMNKDEWIHEYKFWSRASKSRSGKS